MIDAGIDIVVVKSTQNQYFMGSRLFEYPELKMLTDAVASSKIISAKKSEELVQKLCRLAGTYQAEQLQKFAALSSRVKPYNEKVYYIIDNIQTAIGNHQQIRFQYYEWQYLLIKDQRGRPLYFNTEADDRIDFFTRWGLFFLS